MEDGSTISINYEQNRRAQCGGATNCDSEKKGREQIQELMIRIRLIKLSQPLSKTARLICGGWYGESKVKCIAQKISTEIDPGGIAATCESGKEKREQIQEMLI